MTVKVKGLFHIWMTIIATAVLAGCSGSDDDVADGIGGSGVDATGLANVRFIIADPTASDTRASDPGTPTGEDDVWDRLTLIFTYTAPGAEKHCVAKTLTRDEFKALPFYMGNRDIKIIDAYLPEGKIYIYGVTYNAGTSVEESVGSLTQDTPDSDVRALRISNDYAGTGGSMDVARFLSVATGYYRDDDGKIAQFDVEANKKLDEIGMDLPVVRLKRLAVKIDIQWDAQDAYDDGYTNVGVESFTFYNDESALMAGSGFGRLFPDLNSDKLPGLATFYNTSAISKRNGRVYHYVYPDGVSRPKVMFNLTGKDGDGAERSLSYSFLFNEALQPATWYKVNTWVKGLKSGNTSTALSQQ